MFRVKEIMCLGKKLLMSGCRWDADDYASASGQGIYTAGYWGGSLESEIVPALLLMLLLSEYG